MLLDLLTHGRGGGGLACTLSILSANSGSEICIKYIVLSGSTEN